MERYYSHGKLLLTGEYLVLDGALALAIPTRQGQSLIVSEKRSNTRALHWSSRLPGGSEWFAGRFELPSGTYLQGTDESTGRRLEQLFRLGRVLKPTLWEQPPGSSYAVRTELEFLPDWGLGSSSTLVANLARWWGLDPYQLLAGSFGGSGYDLACAGAEGPIFYQLAEERPVVRPAMFAPPFAHQLYFLHLAKKQDSRQGIAHYRTLREQAVQTIERISELSLQMTRCRSLPEFQEILEEHEAVVGQATRQTPVRGRLFPDFPGSLKSLGAWGGDFVLAASEQPFSDLRTYFAGRGLATLIPYSDMVWPAK